MRLAGGCLLLWTVLVRAGLARVCPSMDIRNSASQFSLLKECHRIQGFLQVVLLESSKEEDYVDLSFPNLTEVTSYVIFYRVQGLTSIGKIFPNLSLIGGDVLVKDYALIISQMMDLKEIDLYQLKVIQRGSVAIVKNPKLCYVDTVNWDLIANSGNNWISPTKDKSLCPGCTCPENRCWSRNHCQVLEWGKNCHSECFGGCSGPGPDKCHACKHVMHGKDCVPHCPENTYEFEKRRCVTASECINMNTTLLRPGYNESTESWYIWDTKCVSSCPRGLERDPELGCKPCPGKCIQVCDGANVESIESAQTLRDCTYINGSLEIQIRSGNRSFIYNELEDTLGDIEEIAGYLKVTRSFPLRSLDFLKNLRIIHGNEAYIKPLNYSLIVLENQNLQGLWDWETKPSKTNFTILNGRIFFHYNPNLCLKHIYQLAAITGQRNITNIEVATESNGNKFACHTIDLKVTVKARFSTEVSLFINRPSNSCDSSDMCMYVVYHIIAPFQNMTADYETSECANYGWTLNDVTHSTYYKLRNLEPNTQYAFFVKMYKVNSTGQSEIQYFKTRPSKPTWPNDLQGVSPNHTSITLIWRPPDKANGEINEYKITGFMREEEHNMLANIDFCAPSVREKFTRKKNETAPVIPVFMTNVQPKKEDCCKKNEIIEDPFSSDANSLLCQNLNPKDAKLPSIFLSSIKAKTCEKYMYKLIETNTLEPPAIVTKRNADGKLNISKIIDLYHKDLFQIKDVPFNVKVPGNLNTFTFTNLESYSLYSFQVQACREIDPEIETPNDKNRCSIPSLLTIRTLPNKAGDKISWLDAVTSNRTVELKWEIPIAPNFMILSYEIEYRRTDIPNIKAITDCIKGSEFSKKDSYILNGLALGQYSFRVRAISLAGAGPFTEPISVSISEFSSKIIIILSFSIPIFILVTFGFIGFVLYQRKKMLQRNILIASVNPEYLGVAEVDEEWELPRERVQILKELKRGNFGIVYEGLILPEEKRVAIKKVLETASERDCMEFLNEACVMKQFTAAFHIVKLIGIVSQGWPQLVVMEIMDHGDLKSYLRECRNKDPPTPAQMLLMAAQIADGMAFLEDAKFVHRDLAARNCMVRNDLVVKIGDFGMTRDIYETDYYRKGNRGLLPIRWMAPESLNDGVFSSKSDAWSYGIVLWEMSTLASQPYQGMSNEQVLAYVVSGNKLDLPPVYPKPFKTIMHWCWRWKPKFRPSFLQILNELVEYTPKTFRDVSFYDSPAGRNAREILASLPQQCLLEPSTSTVLYQPTQN